MRSRALLVLTAGFVLVVASCGSKSGGAASAPITGTLIGPQGGTATLAEGITINVPPGAVSAPVLISARVGSDIDTARMQPSGMILSGRPFQLEPAGLVFARPVEVTMPYTLAAGVKPLDMMGAHRDDLQGSIDLVAPASETAQTVLLRLTHFSTVQAVRSSAPPPVVTAVTPPQGRVRGGGSVTITGSDFRDGPGLQVYFGAIAVVGTDATAAVTSLRFVSSTVLRALAPPSPSPAVVDVTVKNGDGPTGTLARAYTYLDALAVSSTSPSSAASGTATPATVSGNGFYGTPIVKVGGLDATNVVVLSQTTLTCTLPDDVSGPKDVVVTTQDGDTVTLAGGFRRVPVLSQISPAAGPLAGGTSVTITGLGFSSDTTVTIGGAALAGTTILNASTITGNTPSASSAGRADVTVSNAGGVAMLANAFHYGVTIGAISPGGGPLAGGTAVTITGTGFVPGTTFTIGGAPVTGTVQSLTTFTGTAPAGTTGYANVVATSSNGAGTLARSFYYGAPRVLAIVPESGPTTLATGVTIRGEGFYAGCTASIGGVGLGDVVVVDGTTLMGVTAGGSAGVADVSVTNLGGSGTLTSGFSYVVQAATPWRAQNTGLYGGDVRGLAIAPSSPSTLYASTSGAGVFKTTNSGLTWNPVNAGLASLSIAAVAVDSTNASVAYASDYSGGLFKTTDGGASWTSSGNGITARVTSIVIDPVTPAIAYATTVGQGVMKTTDGGATWASANAGLGSSADHITIDPTNPSILYVTSTAVFKSTNGGATWTKLPTPSLFPDAAAIAVDPGTPTTVWIANGNGVAKSSDGGATWTTLIADPGVADDFRALAIDPTSPQVVYAATAHRPGFEIYKTTDGGATWTHGAPRLGGSSVGSLVLDPVSPSTLYAGLEGGAGVYKTIDAATSWTNATVGITNLALNAITPAPSAPTTIYVGPPSKGVFKSTNGGLTWVPASTGIADLTNVNVIAVDPTNASTAYAGLYLGGVYKTTDGGASWSPANAGIDAGSIVFALAVKPGSPTTLYAGTQGGSACIWKTTNGGASWAAASSGIDPAHLGYATTFAFDGADSSMIYANPGGNIYRSNDGGSHWTLANSNLGSFFQRLAAVPNAPGTLYGATHSNGVFKTTDGGATWIDANGGSPISAVTALAIDPVSQATIYAGEFANGARLWKTTNGGTSWVALDPGSVGANVASYGPIALDPQAPSTIYLGNAFFGGVLKSTTGGQ